MNHTVIFTGPRAIQIRETPVPEPCPGQVLVQTSLSAISAGTEMLVYRGQFPQHLSLDTSIEGMDQPFSYPLSYGYAAVGQVKQCGEEVDQSHWLGRTVFAFQPHSSHFVVDTGNLLALPNDLPLEDAVFAANMETAVNLVQDGQPLLGERVVVLGQGVVGLLTTALLAQFPLSSLAVVDGVELRRKAARAVGADDSLPPGDGSGHRLVSGRADLVFELTGDPSALNAAIDATGYGGRIVIGSWYGEKTTPIQLGGHFHRSRIEIISSQVSTIAPALRGRWSKDRRFETIWRLLRQVNPAQWITHSFPVERAADAYHLLDEHTDQTIQVVLTY